MSVLTYNQVVLPYASVTSFQQEAIRDEASDTDWSLTRFDIAVTAVITAEYMELLAPDLIQGGGVIPTDSAAFMMDVIRPRLLQHRRALSFKFNGTELIPQPQDGLRGVVDADNGPKPQHCIITDLTNSTFLITYRIVAAYWENDTINIATNPPIITNLQGSRILLNRWEETIDIDDKMFSKRVRRGKYRIRSDNASGATADQLRDIMAPVGVPPGFLRESSQYTISPDGLAIQYQVIDKEVFKYPPYPAYAATGEYSEYLGKMDATREAEVVVRLEGHKPTGNIVGAVNTSQSQLVMTAVNVATAKINLTLPPLGAAVRRPIPIQGHVKVGLYENWAEVRLRYRIFAGTKRFASLAVLSKTFCNTPYSDQVAPGVIGAAAPPAQQPKYLQRGSAQRLLLAAKYFDPSFVEARFDAQGDNLIRGLVPGQAGLTPET